MISKTELKKQLCQLGIIANDNYIKKSEIKKAIVSENSKYVKLKIASDSLKEWDRNYYAVYSEASNNINDLTDQERRWLDSIENYFETCLGIFDD